MPDSVLLVDYENIGKIDLGAIPAGVRVPFFFGASQKSVPTEFLKAARSAPPGHTRRQRGAARGSPAAARGDTEDQAPAQAQGPHRRAALALLEESPRARAAGSGG